MQHPYIALPDRAFWSRAVGSGLDARGLIASGAPLIRAKDRIASAGSCFAANIVPYLERAGYSYVRTESEEIPDVDRFGYSRYSAAYGNIYTARQLLQLVRRVRGTFRPWEDRWLVGDAIIDPFRPGLPYSAESNDEFDVLTSAHLVRTRVAIEQASVFIVTLGLTEAWVSSNDGAVFPACPGTIAGSFDPSRHEFRNFNVLEVTNDLEAAIMELRTINSSLRVLLTVSPVPLVATATDNHVICATAYSKSVLRVACEHISQAVSDVIYFPAYEIIVGSQAPDYFESDKRNIARAGVDAVMSVLLAYSEKPWPKGPDVQSCTSNTAVILARSMADAECEEMMVDSRLNRRDR